MKKPKQAKPEEEMKFIQDTWDSFSYSIVPQAGSSDHLAFSILGSQLRTTRSLNFEQQSVYRIAILATDSGNNTVLKEFNIDVSKRCSKFFSHVIGK
jgi:hypothetical protein